MIHQVHSQVHSLFSPEKDAAILSKINATAISPEKLDSFRGALSDAERSTVTPLPITQPMTSGQPMTSSSNSGGSSSGSTTSTGTTNSGTASSGAPNGGYDPFLQAAYSNPYQNAPLQGSTKSTIQTAAPEDAQQAFDDSYWASQPAPVQALRYMQDQNQREALGTQLAHEGYSIDVPIMVWGWDPSVTMTMRQAEGYTWVPSGLQNPVEVAPGLPAMGSTAAYNPNQAPNGSIAV